MSIVGEAGSKEYNVSWTDKVGVLFPRIEEVSEHLSKEQGEQLVADYLRIVEDVITVRGGLSKNLKSQPNRAPNAER